ncbi:HEAT repeat domain-containing protein [Pajaroellobacter abortibovis]|uniref:HEAT repeat domain-containing protein n=1 Tax=Pajaroellobacter abortibovis TaxID=1882918 RepID=A0A1L6MWJ0_9BACT|nr:HEAT repeat domain-containing protein [Pajaroellobacter abortibovis]APR99787.1 hypothetical protein BCY86_03180 [Pajaroellobacter abortibovis]
MTGLRKTLLALFKAEQQVRQLHHELAQSKPEEIKPLLQEAVQEAKGLEHEEQKILRLVRLAFLLGEFHGEWVAHQLIDILDSDSPEIRKAAGEFFEELAYERFKEAAIAVERALKCLDPSSLALLELPYILVRIGEPGTIKLLEKFLASKNPEVVSAAMEALVEGGDTEAVSLLDPLLKDKREVMIEDDGGEECAVPLGELAKEAQQILRDL